MSSLVAWTVTNVFIGNLASNRTPDEFRELFQAYGLVIAVEIVTDPETRYSREFAFVEMRNDLNARRVASGGNRRGRNVVYDRK
jgi:RNA recognition motif-containing protein